jgi:hypothetical protein
MLQTQCSNEAVGSLYYTLVAAVKEGGEVRLEALTAMLGIFQEEEKRKLAPKDVDIIALLADIVKVCSVYSCLIDISNDMQIILKFLILLFPILETLLQPSAC